MDKLQEELEQIAAWFCEEGLAPDSSKQAQLCLLWRAYQRTRSSLSCVARDLDIQRSQHLAEMAEVRKSLQQIHIFREHKDALAQEIQDENDQLKDQLQRLISLQDAQISEVAKMLYQQGLTELIHSSPSEQVAYLLVERASLLEMTEASDKLTADGIPISSSRTETQIPNSYTHQAEPRNVTGQPSSVERECSRLERDLEEGSRRLAMAHSEIRRLTDELESAHLTQRTYEPELQAAQQEVEQLRQEVEKLKKFEMVELRKAKELNDRLDLEIRALRSRVRSIDAEKKSLQQMVSGCLQKKAGQLESDLQQLQTVHDQECPEYQEAVRTLIFAQDECETLKQEVCETLKCLDKERSKYHEMKEKHKTKLCRAKQKFGDETVWRDEKIKNLERELSLCSHSLAKEKELVTNVTVENEKLLVEKRSLLQQLNEEEHSKKDSHLIASLSKCRVEFLETENKKLGNTILYMSNQLAVLERTVQNMQALYCTEELKKMCNHQICTSHPLQTSSLVKPEPSEIQTPLDDTQSSHTDVTSLPHSLISVALSRSVEMGYLNLTSAQNHSASPAALISSESTCS